jgi:hypothetical protein
MSTVTPPPPPPPTPPAATPAPAPSVVVQQPSAALLALELGAKLEVRVAGTDAQGRVLIDTPVGRLAVQTNTPLPASGPLQLQVQSLGTQVQFLITAIHGKLPTAALRTLTGLLPPTLPGIENAAGQPTRTLGGGPGAANPATGQTGQADTAQRPAAVPVQLTAGTLLRAVLLKPGSALSGPGGAPTTPTSPANTHAAGAAGNATGNTGRVAALANAAKSIAGAAGLGARAAAGSGASGANATPLPAGANFTVRVVNLQPATPGASAASPSATTPLSPGLQLSGTVASGGTGGQTVVQTHAGPVALAIQTQLPAGTRVVLEVVDLPKPHVTPELSAMVRRVGEGILHSQQWPALDDAAETLSQLQPSVAQQLTAAVLPRADAALAANLLFFLFALRGGELRQWMGDAPTRALERLKPALLGRLRDDFSGISKLAEEPPRGDARVLPFPLVHGAEIEQARLLLQRREEDEKDEDDDKRPGPGTRFVVDVTLSRLGRLQLDGFVQDETKRFDLIIRSDRKLAPDVQNGIREIFEGAGEISGAKGGLAFQAAPPGFVDTSGRKPQAGLGVVV